MVIPGNIQNAANLSRGDRITRDGIKTLKVVSTSAKRGRKDAVKVKNSDGGTSKFTYRQIENQFASME